MSSELNKIRERLLALGVAPAVVGSITQADIDRANSADRVAVECHKCGCTHTVEREWAAGRKFVKCGGCYL